MSDAPIRTFSLYFADCAHNTAVNWFKFRDHFVSSLLSRFFAKSSRSDRMAKYNQLLRIEEELGDEAIYGYTKIYRK